MFYERNLDLDGLLKQKSHFLFGPRSTGKSSLIRKSLTHAYIFNLLEPKLYYRWLKKPELLSQEIEALKPQKDQVIVIDEIQKIPALLDEVHRLIEEKKITFLLTGSSSRKLKRSGVNLLAGRAWELKLFPLTSDEISDFNLLKYLNCGGLPQVYTSKNPVKELENYINLYLKEEIQEEALVQRIDHYSRFLDGAATSSGQEINYQDWANDMGIPPRTLANYLDVLRDTLLGFELTGYTKTKKRKAINRSKFYFFDVGVANFLAQRKIENVKNFDYGMAFEHFLIQEVRAAIHYHDYINKNMHYWRSANYEVDLILPQRCAIEIKSSENIQEKHLRGLLALQEEKLLPRYICVCHEDRPRIVKGIEILPWADFLKMLWSQKI